MPAVVMPQVCEPHWSVADVALGVPAAQLRPVDIEEL
jgi:hypothetical protein